MLPHMSRLLVVCFAASMLVPAAAGAADPPGEFFAHDGVKLYYELHGTGEPLLLVHGNGGSTADFKAQIQYFRSRYRLIVMDSRDQGRSSDSEGPITYEKMADDLAALLDHLKVGPVNVLGWSDGGIEALLLAMRHPAKVKKVASMAANLDPSENAVHAEVIAAVKTMIAAMPPNAGDTPQGRRELKLARLVLEEPHIPPVALQAITAPTLVLASDHDVIRDEHTVAIYRALPNAQLVIFPNATHMIPFDDPATFNTAVDRFFRRPFVKKDRVADMFKSLEKMRSQK
jgi:pimeloyl-ACP methyl ester carboxylesterase